MWLQAAKRALDLVTAALLIVILSLPLFVVWAWIRVSMGRPALFCQPRVGLNGATFLLYKFRTMTLGVDNHGSPLPDEHRLTSLGRTLRRFSMDEIPQLWNVLRGDMSLVGPRPLLPEYLPRYTPSQRRRHEVKPGITGWAQVNGRNGLTWEQKFDLDVWYVDHQTLRLDLKILWMTLVQVLRRDGISQPGHATMPEFMGAKQAPEAKA